jgi:hypothetical protein
VFSSPCVIHCDQNSVQHVVKSKELLSAFYFHVSHIPATINVGRDKTAFPLRCPEFMEQRFFYVTDFCSFLIRFAKAYRDFYRGLPPITVENVSFGALVLEPVRCLTLSLEPNACNLTCVFPLILQFLYFCKLILQYKEIPLPQPWRQVLMDISREYVRMTVGSRNRTFLVFASTFGYYGRFVFGGRLGDMVAELGRGLYLSPHVQQLFTYARNVDVLLQHVRPPEPGEPAVAQYPQTAAEAQEYLRHVLPRKRTEQGCICSFVGELFVYPHTYTVSCLNCSHVLFNSRT